MRARELELSKRCPQKHLFAHVNFIYMVSSGFFSSSPRHEPVMAPYVYIYSPPWLAGSLASSLLF